MIMFCQTDPLLVGRYLSLRRSCPVLSYCCSSSTVYIGLEGQEFGVREMLVQIEGFEHKP